jgi:hypothetical protein
MLSTFARKSQQRIWRRELVRQPIHRSGRSIDAEVSSGSERQILSNLDLEVITTNHVKGLFGNLAIGLERRRVKLADLARRIQSLAVTAA